MKIKLLIIFMSFIALSGQGQTILVGMTENGGPDSTGTIFSYNISTRTEAVLYTFSKTGGDGTSPRGSLIQASNGLLYGMTTSGGADSSGTIFSLDLSNNTETVLHSFNFNGDGGSPAGSLLQASDGKLYGMTRGGMLTSWGTIFRYDIATGTETVLHQFAHGFTDGYSPQGSLIQIGDSMLYGMTYFGGSANHGTIISYNIYTDSEKVVYSFKNSGGDGGYPMGDLLQANNGLLYGMNNQFGGTNGFGSLFSFNIATDTEKVVHTFRGSLYNDGSYPTGSVIQASNGKLYGMTSGVGSTNDNRIFSFDIPTDSFYILHDFIGTSDGMYPYGSLIQASNGLLYGLTSEGGAYLSGPYIGQGAIFDHDLRTDTIGISDTVLHGFRGGTDGMYPYGNLTEVYMPSLAVSVILTGHSPLCNGDYGSAAAHASGGSASYGYIWSNGSTSDSISQLGAGTYIVTVTSGGQSVVDSISISNPSSVQTPTITTLNDTLISSSAIGDQWYWDSVIIPGATSQDYYPTESGYYSVQTTDSNGCSAISAPISFTLTGILENTCCGDLMIAPNPGNGKFHIYYEQLMLLSIKVYNNVGAVIYHSNDVSSDIDLSGYAKGNYDIILQTDQGTITRKLAIY